ncbi:hypothetical protein AB3466_14025 [Sphingobacterium thalpophilum]|uniref:hypothetical protein n=1 Tax=Sphingobacterium thalpophilum TaxID=259 RepID=UPI0037DA1B7E
MKKPDVLIAIFIASIIVINFTSCGSQQQKKNQYEFVEADSLDIQSVLKPPQRESLTFKGAVWDTWNKLHKSCMQNTFFKRPTYLGLSNTVDLGSVFSKSGDILEWDFGKLFNDQDRKKVINTGQPQPCSYTEQLKVDFQAFIATELPSTGIEGELSAAIKNQKDISVKIDNWQIDRIINGELKFLLDSSTDPKVLQFKKDLLEKNLIMISQVARINGFSSIINLNSEMSAELQAKLKEGITKNIGNTEARIKFGYSSAKQIIVVSQGSFIVFAEFIKVKKINN